MFNFRDFGLITVFINFTAVGIKRKLTFKVQVQQSSCIRDFMRHLKASKGITGKIVGGELSESTTLAEAGIVTMTVLEMEGFTTPKRFTQKVAVKLPDGRVIDVHVHSGTTIGELKHKIQDEIGMLVEEQVLRYHGRLIKQDELSIEICGHKKTPLVLRWHRRKEPSHMRKVPARHVQSHRMIEHKTQDETDGPIGEQILGYGGRQIVQDKLPEIDEDTNMQAHSSKMIRDHKTQDKLTCQLESRFQDTVHGSSCRQFKQDILNAQLRKDANKLQHQQKTEGQNSAFNRTTVTRHAVPTSDLSELVRLPVAAYWRSLGVQLGVPPDRLDTIQYNNAHYPDSANQCLTAMFDWWLKNIRDSTYENLNAALETIGRRDLALKVFVPKISSSGLSRPRTLPPILHQTAKHGQ